MDDEAKARLARADDVDVFELPSDVDVTCSAPDDTIGLSGLCRTKK